MARVFRIFLDIGPLQEQEFTGISQVTAKAAEGLLGDSEIEAQFIFGDFIVPKKVVESLLYHRNGSFFRYHFGAGDLDYADVRSLVIAPNDRVACLYPNVKTSRNFFPIESQIIHDISTLLVPEYHTEETIRYHAYSLAEDLATNDITFCVSEATRNDIVTYFDVPKKQTRISYLGSDVVPAKAALEGGGEPYILVLGTLEPRKNLSLVLHMLSKHPELLTVYRVLVVGRVGWGEEFQVMLWEAGLADPFRSGRLQFLGFVDEGDKCSLIQNASLMIYPSMFEGFGLPVLEALSLATPVVTSFSSSLPEVGGGAAYYCDPTHADSLWNAVLHAIGDIETRPVSVSASCLRQASKFSWKDFYQTLKGGLIEAHVEKFGQGGEL